MILIAVSYLVLLVLGAGAVIAVFLARERAVDAERQRWERERASLLNRINPATAQAILEPDDGAVLPQPAADSDEWWKNFQEHFTAPVGDA